VKEQVVLFYFTIHNGDIASFIGKKLSHDVPQFNKFEEMREKEPSLQLTAAQHQQAVTDRTDKGTRGVAIP